MHPITHLLSGWVIAVLTVKRRQDKTVVAWSSVVPDLDGVGYVVDLATLFLEVPQTYYYEMFHRIWGHGLLAALVLALVLLPWLYRRPHVLLLAVAAIHLHFLQDILGSRGELSGQIWPIYYLAPISTEAAVISWSGQWPLGGWQNAVITLGLILFGLWRGLRHGATPLEVISPKADRHVVAALRRRFHG